MPNPAYLGQSGATGTDGQSGSGTARATTATTLGSGMGTATSGTSPVDDTTGGRETGGTPCTGSGCVEEARCYDAKGPSRVELGDVDGDGRLDVVSLSFETEVLHVWSTASDGELVVRTDHDVGARPASLAVFDTNGDGRAELVTAVAADDRIVVIDTLDDARFRTQLAGAPAAVDAGDANQDGLPDLVVATTKPAQIRWAFSLGDGTFELGPVRSVDLAPTGVALGLVDVDAVFDAFVFQNVAGGLGCFRGVADQGFADGVASTAAFGAYALDTADLNHDGAVDAVISSASSQTLEVLSDSGGLVFSSAEVIVLGETPGQVQLADIDLDGEPEIIVAMQSTPEVWIYPGTADLQHGEPIRAKLPGNGDGLAVGDLNGDGRPDIVASVTEASAVCVLLADSV